MQLICSFLAMYSKYLIQKQPRDIEIGERGEGWTGSFIKISASTFRLFSHCVDDAMKWKSMQMHSGQHHGNNYNDNEDE